VVEVDVLLASVNSMGSDVVDVGMLCFRQNAAEMMFTVHPESTNIFPSFPSSVAVNRNLLSLLDSLGTVSEFLQLVSGTFIF
jgi:hypothetical protein